MMISFSPVFVAIADTGPTTSAFYRVALGGLILMAVLFVRRQTRWPRGRTTWFLVLAGVALAADLSLWHRSILYIGPGLSTIIGNFQVFVVAGFGVFFLRERLTARLGLSIPLALFGLYLIFGLRWTELGTDFRLGVLYGILTAVTYGGFIILLRHVQQGPRRVDPVTTLCALSLVAAVFLLLVLRIEGESVAIPNLKTGIALGAYAVVSHVIGWWLITTGLPHVPVSRTGLILLLQPSLAFVWDIVFFGRPTVAVEVAGACLALGAIYLGSSSPRTDGEAAKRRGGEAAKGLTG